MTQSAWQPGRARQGVLLRPWLLGSLAFNSSPSSIQLSRLISDLHRASGQMWLERATCFKALSLKALHCPFLLTSPVWPWEPPGQSTPSFLGRPHHGHGLAKHPQFHPLFPTAQGLQTCHCPVAKGVQDPTV